jgi:hypothetical protein
MYCGVPTQARKEDDEKASSRRVNKQIAADLGGPGEIGGF